MCCQQGPRYFQRYFLQSHPHQPQSVVVLFLFKLRHIDIFLAQAFICRSLSFPEWQPLLEDWRGEHRSPPPLSKPFETPTCRDPHFHIHFKRSQLKCRFLTTKLQWDECNQSLLPRNGNFTSNNRLEIEILIKQRFFFFFPLALCCGEGGASISTNAKYN